MTTPATLTTTSMTTMTSASPAAIRRKIRMFDPLPAVRTGTPAGREA
jgi:hypothetical protein